MNSIHAPTRSLSPRSSASSHPSKWKSEFVRFISEQTWHWFVTIPIGECPDDDELLRRLGIIEAELTGKHVSRKFGKLDDAARYRMAVAFEGDRASGTRHAHILVYVPPPRRKTQSHQLATAFFPMDYRQLWHHLQDNESPFDSAGKKLDKITFSRSNLARSIYAVKRVQQDQTHWSRFEFVTPPRYEKFDNENLRLIRNRDRQKRQAVGLSAPARTIH
jgi:hypothetical protein